MSKKITELQLISSVTDSLNFPADNGIQTYRATAAQIKNYILAASSISRSMLAQGAIGKKGVTVVSASTYTADIDDDDLLLIDSTSNTVTVSLPAASSHEGREFIAFVSSYTNAITVDGNSLYYDNDFIHLISDGTNWIMVDGSSRHEISYGVFNLTVTGNFSWSTTAAKGIVKRIGSQWLLEFQIEGTTSSTNQVDIGITGCTGLSSFNYQSVHAVGPFSAGQATNAGYRTATSQIEMRASTNDTTWNCNGKIFLNAKPSFV